MVDAWTTPAGVLGITGVAVDDQTVLFAQSQIELVCGRLYGDTMGNRDKVWLGRAVAYQAAWLPSQPDWAQRLEIVADGSPQYGTQLAPDGVVLAPYAKRALNRVSWVRSRGLQVQGPADNTSDEEPEDSEPGWSPWKSVGA